jgi:glycine dehydrogenase
MNFRYFDNGEVGLSIDQTTNLDDINWILEVFAKAANKPFKKVTEYPSITTIQPEHLRTSASR